MPTVTIREFAPAKINLTLRVLGRRADGYHALESLVAFALDSGDRISLEPGPDFSLTTTGPEATAIDGPNLITKVAETILSCNPGLTSGAFHLEKNLPVASGIGGGSTDAAAALRSIARVNQISDPGVRFAETALALGADIPVCIGDQGRGPTAAFMTGIGEKVWRPDDGRSLLPTDGLAAVLVNPRVPVATAAVFKTLAAPSLTTEPSARPPAPFASQDECLAYVASHPNDLEAPAGAMAPVIAEVLDVITDLPGCRCARMSGSGATCFGLFDGLDQAKVAATHLRSTHPEWWASATRLG